MSFFKTLLVALAVAPQFTSVLAAPPVREGAILSIRAADIVKNDLSAAEDHPLMGLYNHWLQNSPHAALIRRNASMVMERFPTFTSVECHEDKNTCLLTSRMAMSNEMAALAPRDEPNLRRDLFWDTTKLVVEVHYKTYHWLGKDESEYAGFEQYITWDWNCRTVLYKSTGSALADHSMTEEKAAGVVYLAQAHTTIMHDGPLHNEDLRVTFKCGLFSNKCCIISGEEQLFINGRESVHWAAKPERTCNWDRADSWATERDVLLAPKGL